MEIIADLHLHSKYSRAVSPQMVIPEIAKWAARKGIGLVAAPDWTHPLWLKELKNELVEAGEGIYKLKVQSINGKSEAQNAKLDSKETKFILATEISSIYSQGGKTRRIHNLVLAPSFAVVDKINAALTSRGANLFSDGRPIVGLSSIELCELIFSISKDCLVIPAHAWTPWFSLYGSKSGFNSIDECFGQFADRILAIETGLSSDPAMNWRIGELDARSIVSFSDAHSSAKLGREATVFELESLSYKYLKEALKVSQDNQGNRVNQDGDKYTVNSATGLTRLTKKSKIAYTIEFYPEEGKYHYTGHRNCKVKQTPEETKKLGATCPVCGRQLTVGVMHRVEQLATRGSGEVKGEKWETGREIRGVKWDNRPPYVMLVPLMEILAESLGAGSGSQSVANECNRLVEMLGSEFKILLNTPTEEIAKISGEKIAEGVKRVREGNLVIDPGYDGEFGKVKIWPSNSDKNKPDKQMSLF